MPDPKSLSDVLNKLASAAQAAQKEEKPKMFKKPLIAQCKRLANRETVIGSTVFKFNSEGMCTIYPDKARTKEDFIQLCKLNGVKMVKGPKAPKTSRAPKTREDFIKFVEEVGPLPTSALAAAAEIIGDGTNKEELWDTITSSGLVESIASLEDGADTVAVAPPFQHLATFEPTQMIDISTETGKVQTAAVTFNVPSNDINLDFNDKSAMITEGVDETPVKPKTKKKGGRPKKKLKENNE